MPATNGNGESPTRRPFCNEAGFAASNSVGENATPRVTLFQTDVVNCENQLSNNKNHIVWPNNSKDNLSTGKKNNNNASNLNNLNNLNSVNNVNNVNSGDVNDSNKENNVNNANANTGANDKVAETDTD